MSIMPFGAYRPDVSDYEGTTSGAILNALPRGDGYGPFASLSAYTSALPGQCRGVFYARKSDGSIQIFAGTSNKLFTLNSTTLIWQNVSKTSRTAGLALALDSVSELLLANGTDRLLLTTGTTGTSYSALSSGANWEFAQFNNFVIAVQVNAPPQVYDLTSSTLFADLGGSPPQAAYISIVNRFVVLSGLASPNVYRIQWSGLNAVTTWTSGVNQSDYQDLPDGGIVRGVAGGEYGTIFQDASIRAMNFAPGSPYVFGITRVSQDDGLFAPGSLIAAQDRIFFCSPQGFKMLVPGSYPAPIGKEKVDRTFFADVDNANLQLMIGVADPKHTRVYWAYKSINGTTAQFDKILCYDWALERWVPVRLPGEYLASLSRPGITLENVDTAYGPNIDTIALSSLDDITSSVLSSLSGFDTSHKLGFFTGANLEATLETGEHGGDGKRIYIRGYRPVTDAATVYGSVGKRETLQATRTYSDETLVNSIGKCTARVSTRYGRSKIRIPASVSWTFAAGVEPDVVLEGEA